MTALALREDQDYWDDKQLAVLDQSGISTGVSKAELAAFLHVCQRTGLDPFARQIYLIGRWDKKAGRELYRPQTGIDGYRIVAQRTCERTRQALGYEDTLWCGATGEWVDVWLGTDPPAAAKVTVLRDGKRFPAIARWSEYVPLNNKGEITGLWGKRSAAQLEKCAEALALRKAFPNDMAGVYTAEEMAQADNPHPVQAAAERVREDPPAPRRRPRQVTRDGGDWGDWPAVIESIDSPEAAEKAIADLSGVFRNGAMDEAKFNAIRRAMSIKGGTSLHLTAHQDPEHQRLVESAEDRGNEKKAERLKSVPPDDEWTGPMPEEKPDD